MYPLGRRDSNDSTVKITAGGQEIKTKPYAKGGGRPKIIKKDQIFGGRIQGGGKRKQIYGTRDYGSGYPGGGNLRGTNGRGFPFYFWPVVWANPSTVSPNDAYLHPTEYGLPDNTTRPGGPLATLTYISETPDGSIFRILTDFASAAALIPSLTVCSSFVNLSSVNPSPYLQFAPSPLPEQTLQYYRASSAALTLDGYNNTAVLQPQDSSGAYNVLLPSGTDVELLRCLNTTIGNAILLNDPPKLSGDAIGFIAVGSSVAAFFVALLIPGLCVSFLESCRSRWRRYRHRRQETRCKPLTVSLPCTIDRIRAPQTAVIVLPPNGEPLSSGKAGELIEEDDVASITKNAQAFAGTQSHGSVNSDRRGDRPPWWWWVAFAGRDNKGSEDIEMKGRN
ncbi:hypothetical protein C0995_000034 [Termitomyces sp. Mi166|nr:hypothetical protein C0995_000034 [Termitomyces sp. Mi166\